MLVVITGPRGIGKTSVCRELVKHFGFGVLKSITTRPVTQGDDGEEYTHVAESRDFFKVPLAEFIEYNGHFYGTPMDEVLKTDILTLNFCKIIEESGVKAIKGLAKCPVVHVFLDATDRAIKQRMVEGGSSEDEIETRMNLLPDERKYKNKADVCVETDFMTPEYVAAEVFRQACDYVRRTITSLFEVKDPHWYLMYGLKEGCDFHLRGFVREEDLDRVIEEFKQTGKITINDYFIGHSGRNNQVVLEPISISKVYTKTTIIKLPEHMSPSVMTMRDVVQMFQVPIEETEVDNTKEDNADEDK